MSVTALGEVKFQCHTPKFGNSQLITSYFSLKLSLSKTTSVTHCQRQKKNCARCVPDKVCIWLLYLKTLFMAVS